VLWSTPPAPLLVLARFDPRKQLTKNKSHGVTPFWHNDTRSRVTVTFGTRGLFAGIGPLPGDRPAFEWERHLH